MESRSATSMSAQSFMAPNTLESLCSSAVKFFVFYWKVHCAGLSPHLLWFLLSIQGREKGPSCVWMVASLCGAFLTTRRGRDRLRLRLKPSAMLFSHVTAHPAGNFVPRILFAGSLGAMRYHLGEGTREYFWKLDMLHIPRNGQCCHYHSNFGSITVRTAQIEQYSSSCHGTILSLEFACNSAR